MSASIPTILIAGGSSGIGLAAAEHFARGGKHVTLVGRNADKLDAARAFLGGKDAVRTMVADITQEPDVESLFSEVRDVEHIVCTAADTRGAYELLPNLKLEGVQRAIDSKLIAPIMLAKHGAPRLPKHGSMTFTSGIVAYRPGPRSAVVAAVNAALEGLVRAMAVELAPIRVNAVCPGWVDTPLWDAIAGDRKQEMFAAMADRLPAGKVGDPADLAQAIAFLTENAFTTGSVLHVDGGHRLI
jgi:NAD(P)-dependent dehydrogenase (short-subunit alcohol dehydrogenase family)